MDTTNESFARLELRSGRREDGEDRWVDAGPIHLDETTAASVADAADAAGPPEVTASRPPTAATRQRHLPDKARRLLSPHTKVKGERRAHFLFKHSADGADTNLLVTLHGAGDTHASLHRLARRMDLPQTAMLSIHASSCEIIRFPEGTAPSNGFTQLPFGLGWTWFEEMDYSTGDPLGDDSPRRLATLNQAAEKLVEILDALSASDDISTGDSGGGWQPERIFLFGYSAGACLAMETCLRMMTKGSRPLGGGVCIAGGIKCEMPSNSESATVEEESCEGYTPILLVVGALDHDMFPPSSAARALQLYKDRYHSLPRRGSRPTQSMQAPALEPVTVFVKEDKGHSMIGSEEEMRAVMEFLGRTLVRSLPAMEQTAVS